MSGEEPESNPGSEVMFGDVTDAIRQDRALLRHFSTLHDQYYHGDNSLSSKESKTAMAAIMASLWGKVQGIVGLGHMLPEPNADQWVILLDQVGEGPLGSYFGFQSASDIPGNVSTDEYKTARLNPETGEEEEPEDHDINYNDSEIGDDQDEEEFETPISPVAP